MMKPVMDEEQWREAERMMAKNRRIIARWGLADA